MNFDVLNAKKDHKVSKEQTVKRIRSAMNSHLTKGGFPETTIFLIDNKHPLGYDFSSLNKTMIEGVPKWKQEAMIFSMKTLTEDMIEKKTKALKRRIMLVAVGSGVGAAIPVPGVSLCVDGAIGLGEVTFYRNQFGLDDKTLEHHAETLGMSIDVLIAELNITSHFICASLRSVALFVGTLVVTQVAESAFALMPIVGSAIAATMSYGSLVAVLRSLLKVCVSDAVAINKALLNGLTYCPKDWDSHIKELKKRGADDACICSFDGNILAKSDGFNASQKELVTAIKAAITKGKTIVGDDGKLEFEGVPFMKMENLTGDHVGCTLISKPAGEKVFCCVACSNKAVVFVTKRGVVTICEDEVKYLKDSGY